jgi:hypothetical protein
VGKGRSYEWHPLECHHLLTSRTHISTSLWTAPFAPVGWVDSCRSPHTSVLLPHHHSAHCIWALHLYIRISSQVHQQVIAFQHVADGSCES